MSNPDLPGWATKMSADSLFDCVEKDIGMLRDGSWVPDKDSCDDLLTVVEEIKRRFTNQSASIISLMNGEDET